MAAGIFLDLASNAIVGVGNTYATPVSGTGGLTTIDLVDSVANFYTAFITCTAVTGSGNVTFKMQQSTDNSTWTDVPASELTSAFTAVTAANTQQIVSYQNVGRYTRFYATLNSGTSVTVALTVFGQRQTVPANSGGFSNAAAGL